MATFVAKYDVKEPVEEDYSSHYHWYDDMDLFFTITEWCKVKLNVATVGATETSFAKVEMLGPVFNLAFQEATAVLSHDLIIDVSGVGSGVQLLASRMKKKTKTTKIW